MKITELKKRIQSNNNYKSIPFWSWNNKVQVDELLKQIDDMYSVNVKGFIIHARTGLKNDYLGDDWFNCVTACLDKAKKLNLEVWIYDENGWPSGFVGGKLLEREDYLAKYLNYKIIDYYDQNAYAVFEKVNDTYKYLDGYKEGVKEYHTVYVVNCPSQTDILNPNVVEDFIKETHEKYYERYSERFGKELVGFFTDEPQFYRWATPYSIMLDGEFKKIGYELKENIIYLFVRNGGELFRYNYYSIMNNLYTNNYYKKIYDWCEAHNCKLTGHSIEECGIPLQMMATAGVTPSYEFEQMPGIDWLGKNNPSELMPKQIGSVSMQLNKKYVLTETFACCGYDVSPMELKHVAEFQYFGGINVTCQHLYPYSLASQGKFDHPPIFSKQSGWFKEFGIFNDYFANLGVLIGETKEIYDVGVIHPLKDAYSDFIKKEEWTCLSELDQNFDALLTLLQNNGITYHLIDENVLKNNGKVDSSGLIVGNCKYTTVIIPKMKTIANSTYNFLKNYKGKLLNLGEITRLDGVDGFVDLKSNITFEDICTNRKIKFNVLNGNIAMNARESDLGRFLFVVNISNKIDGAFSLEEYKDYRLLDLEDYSLCEISKENILNKGQSMILYRTDESTKNRQEINKTIDIKDGFKCKNISKNSLVLDYAEVSYDGEKYSEKMPIQQIFEQLLRKNYKGKIYVRQRFNVVDKMPLNILCEMQNYDFFTVNGKPVKMQRSEFDIYYYDIDISNVIKNGENEIIYSLDYYQHADVSFALFDKRATENLKNCLYFDSSIENLIIQGDFALDKDFRINRKTENVDITDIVSSGYPFLSGDMTLSGNYYYDGKSNIKLKLNGKYIVANVYVNDNLINYVLSNEKDITEYLKKGNNEIVIVLKFGIRNLIGPHHRKNASPDDLITPYDFTLRGTWENGMSEDYTENYNLAKFGVEQILIEELK